MQLFQSNKYKFSVVYVVILYNTYKIKFNILTLRVMLIGSLKKKEIHLLSNVVP